MSTGCPLGVAQGAATGVPPRRRTLWPGISTLLATRSTQNSRAGANHGGVRLQALLRRRSPVGERRAHQRLRHPALRRPDVGVRSRLYRQRRQGVLLESGSLRGRNAENLCRARFRHRRSDLGCLRHRMRGARWRDYLVSGLGPGHQQLQAHHHQREGPRAALDPGPPQGRSHAFCAGLPAHLQGDDGESPDASFLRTIHARRAVHAVRAAHLADPGEPEFRTQGVQVSCRRGSGTLSQRLVQGFSRGGHQWLGRDRFAALSHRGDSRRVLHPLHSQIAGAVRRQSQGAGGQLVGRLVRGKRGAILGKKAGRHTGLPEDSGP